MATSAIRLAALPVHGRDLHIVTDFEVTDNGIETLTACGKIFSPMIILEVNTHQIGCTRCRSVAKQYNFNIGYQTIQEDNANDIPF